MNFAIRLFVCTEMRNTERPSLHQMANQKDLENPLELLWIQHEGKN